MLTKNFSTWPCFSVQEAEKVKKILLSNKVNYWTGNECKLFEKEFSHFAQTKYAIALANGSVALDVALMSLNIGKGDEVLVTPRSYIAQPQALFCQGLHQNLLMSVLTLKILIIAR